MSKVRPFARGLVLAGSALLLSATPAMAQEKPRVLVLHETKGAAHDSVAAGVQAIEAAAGDELAVDTHNSSSPAFTPQNLARYRAVVFLSTSGDVLDASEEAAFAEFISNGGGFVGIHDAARLEPSSEWFTGLIGTRPAQSPADVQEAVVEVPDRVHPATREVPLASTRDDEWFNWDPNPAGSVHTLAIVRERSYRPGAFANGWNHPISWCHDYEGGRAFYTGMGHTAASFGTPNLRAHLRGGLRWAAGLVRGNCKATISDNYVAERLTEPNALVGATPAERLDQIGEPHGISIAEDGRAFYIGRGDKGPGLPDIVNIGEFWPQGAFEGAGTIHAWDPATGRVTVSGVLEVFGDSGSGDELRKKEEGLVGITLDPNFMQNGWIYTHWTPWDKVDFTTHLATRRISRFTVDLATNKIDMGSEKVLLEWQYQAHNCCHMGGDMAFDSDGNLYIATGDTNSSGSVNGYSGNFSPNQFPHQADRTTPDPSVGVGYNDARRTAGNTNDLNGKVLRIHPEADGTYTVPDGNLFPEAGDPGNKTRPEVYAMGVRNPARLWVDKQTGWLMVGWVGPDAGQPNPALGPAKYESLAAIPKAGNFGWPYCMGNKQPYRDRDLKGNPTGWYDCDKPVNDSVWNTGLRELPPVTPVNMWYSPQGGGPVFPIDPETGRPDYGGNQTFTQPYLRSRGCQAVMSGPMYRHDDSERADRWPAFWDGKWFVGDECGGNSRVAVALDEDAVENHKPPKSAVDVESIVGEEVGGLMGWRFAPDGQLYVLDYGTGFFTVSDESALWRVRYTGGESTPSATPTATSGPGPRQVRFSSAGSGGVSYKWDFGDGSPTSNEPNPEHTYAQAGEYRATLTVTYAGGESVHGVDALALEPPDTVAPVTTAVVDGATVSFRATDSGGARLGTTEYRVDGGEWQDYGRAEEPIFDGTQASLDRWRQAPDGSFALQPDGSIQSEGGLGMLWYPVTDYGDFSLKLQWRDLSAGEAGNSGVFVRFPDPRRDDLPACRDADDREAWHAIYCGQEIQLNDAQTTETQKTGSIYNFDPVGLDEAGAVPKEQWSEIEIRVVGQRYTVLRDGEVINTFDNQVPRASSRTGDPPTQARQFAEGYIGVQNHGNVDKIQIKDIRAQELGGGSGPFEVTGAGTHTVEFRSTDTAGNVEAVKSQAITIPGGGTPPGSPPGGTAPAPAPPGTEPGAAFGVRAVGRPRLGSFARNGLRLTVACEATGSGSAALKVASSTRRRLGLRSTTLASSAVRCTAGRTASVRLEPSKAMARRLQAGLKRRRATKQLSSVLELRMRPAGGDRVQVLQRRLTLRR